MVLTEKQTLALVVLRDYRASGGDWMPLSAVADTMETSRRSAGIILGGLERLGLVLRWEPMGRAYPRFISLGEGQ